MKHAALCFGTFIAAAALVGLSYDDLPRRFDHDRSVPLDAQEAGVWAGSGGMVRDVSLNAGALAARGYRFSRVDDLLGRQNRPRGARGTDSRKSP